MSSKFDFYLTKYMGRRIIREGIENPLTFMLAICYDVAINKQEVGIMVTCIVFLAIVFIHMPVKFIIDGCNGNTGMTDEERRRRKQQVKYEDKMDNDYGFINYRKK